MSDRYAAMFGRTRDERRGAFVPFVTLGDPDLATSRLIVESVIRGGADALELGIPFSDPVADGPTVQAGNVRALEAGVTPPDCWRLLGEVRAAHPDMPVGLLVYANLVEVHGCEAFYQQAADSGVDSVLIADMPSAEARPYVECAREHGVHAVLVVPPAVTDERLALIAELTGGYTYVLARSGVTGVDQEVAFDRTLLARLREIEAPPSLLGFGISKPEHVREAIQAGAAGAISGSAIVNRIATRRPNELFAELEAFVRSMASATSWVE